MRESFIAKLISAESQPSTEHSRDHSLKSPRGLEIPGRMKNRERYRNAMIRYFQRG